jgi:dimethylaniline monooxygenase (N-oxide forming)
MSLLGIMYLPESISPNVPSHPDVKSRRYAVIGAGAAGLCAIKYLKQAGAEHIDCYEAGSKIGGLWCYGNDSGTSSAYRTLHINTPRTLTRFSHMDLPEHVQAFPHHTELYQYLLDYAEKFDLVRHVRFQSRVVELQHAAAHSSIAGKWELKTEDGEGQIYDCVIVATGHLTKPAHVSELRENFTGTYMHAHDYRQPEDFVGKRVCIVGAANSAFDIATDICVTAKRTVMVARSGVVVSPKTVFGVPFRDITLHLDRPWVPDYVRRRASKFLIWLMHGDMTKLGFKKQARRQHATSNGALVNHINYRRIEIKHGIDRVDGQSLFFSDGKCEEFDCLVAATGYRVNFPFLSQDIVPTDGEHLDLYKRIVPPGQPGLFFLGYVNTSIALMLMFEHQMKWILEFESGQAELPDIEVMRADIEAKKRWVSEQYGDSPRYNLEEPHLVYFPQLQRSITEGKKRSRSRRKGNESTRKPVPFECSVSMLT